MYTHRGMCAYVFSCVCVVYMYMHIHVPGKARCSSLGAVHLVCRNWIRLGWLMNLSQPPQCWGYSTCLDAHLFTWMLDIELTSPCKHFTD